MRPLSCAGLRDSGRNKVADMPMVPRTSGKDGTSAGGKHQPAPPDDTLTLEDLLLLVKLRREAAE